MDEFGSPTRPHTHPLCLSDGLADRKFRFDWIPCKIEGSSLQTSAVVASQTKTTPNSKHRRSSSLCPPNFRSCFSSPGYTDLIYFRNTSEHVETTFEGTRHVGEGQA